MAKDPAFLFYTSDFITGVSFLSMEERGQYITALCLLHQHGGFLPKEDIEIVVGKLSKKTMSKFVIDKDGIIHNKRLLEETEKRIAFCESRRRSRMFNIRKTHVKHTENANANEDVNKDTYLEYVLLTKAEHEKLVNTYGPSLTAKYIENLNLYAAQKPKKFKEYASHYATIQTWMRRDNVKKLQPKPKEQPQERFVQPTAEDRAKLSALTGKIGKI